MIPAEIRRRLGLGTGDTLLVRVQEESLVLERREVVMARVKAWFDDVPPGVSLAEELLEERRAEVKRDEGSER